MYTPWMSPFATDDDERSSIRLNGQALLGEVVEMAFADLERTRVNSSLTDQIVLERDGQLGVEQRGETV